MEYTIGEVAEILHLSRDMIRYYEKQGTITSVRNAENNYRTYEIKDVFWLLEAIMHKNFGMNIKEITSFRSKDYEERFSAYLEDFAKKQEQESRRSLLLAARSRELAERVKLAEDNIGCMWVAEIPACYSCHLVDGRGDVYERVTLKGRNSELLFSDEVNPFVDPYFDVHGDVRSWDIRIRESYVSALNIRLTDDFDYVPESRCFCTNVDIGKMMHFDTGVIDGFKALVRKRYGPSDLRIRGLLVSRGVSTGSFHRIVELQAVLE